MDYQTVIDHYYKEDTPLRHILLLHSRQVADRALLICDRHPEFGLDRDFIEAAAMLHDIGIRECDAPGIFCFGHRPYIQHGLAGAMMLKEDCGEAIARVCQRHTGAGITRQDVLAQGLPLPLPDGQSEPYMPETLEEQVVCYADKFYSKSSPDRVRTVLETAQSLEKFGHEGVEKFLEWAKMFE